MGCVRTRLLALSFEGVTLSCEGQPCRHALALFTLTQEGPKEGPLNSTLPFAQLHPRELSLVRLIRTKLPSISVHLYPGPEPVSAARKFQSRNLFLIENYDYQNPC
jgi:hypothetical protein